MADAGVDAAEYLGVGDEHTFLARHGTAVMGQYQFLFQTGNFEMPVVQVQGFNLFVFQPVMVVVLQ